VSNKISLESRLTTNPNLVLRVEEDDCGLLFNPDSGEVKVLNRSAVAIWQLIDGRRSVGEVVTALGEVFEGMDAEAESQVLQVVDSLVEIGAVALAEQNT
jgi:hypothetical protein